MHTFSIDAQKVPKVAARAPSLTTRQVIVCNTSRVSHKQGRLSSVLFSCFVYTLRTIIIIQIHRALDDCDVQHL